MQCLNISKVRNQERRQGGYTRTTLASSLPSSPIHILVARVPFLVLVHGRVDVPPKVLIDVFPDPSQPQLVPVPLGGVPNAVLP